MGIIFISRAFFVEKRTLICYNEREKKKEEKEMEKNNNLVVNLSPEKKSGLIFSAVSVLPSFIATVFLIAASALGLMGEGYETKQWFLYANFLLPQIAFALAFFFFLFYAKTPVRAAFGLPKARYFLLAVVLQFGLLSLGELNGLFLRFLGEFGYVNTLTSLPSTAGFGIVGVLITVALLPAVFEEGVFRGVMLGGMRSFGAVGCVLISGALFALFHQNPAQTLYQFCCGAAYALLAYKAGSAIPTMIAHLLNNAQIVLFMHFGIADFGAAALPVAICSGVCLIAVVLYLAIFDCKKEKVEEMHSLPEPVNADKKGFFITASVGIVLCAINWISTLVSGF